MVAAMSQGAKSKMLYIGCSAMPAARAIAKRVT